MIIPAVRNVQPVIIVPTVPNRRRSHPSYNTPARGPANFCPNTPPERQLPGTSARPNPKAAQTEANVSGDNAKSSTAPKSIITAPSRNRLRLAGPGSNARTAPKQTSTINTYAPSPKQRKSPLAICAPRRPT